MPKRKSVYERASRETRKVFDAFHNDVQETCASSSSYVAQTGIGDACAISHETAGEMPASSDDSGDRVETEGYPDTSVAVPRPALGGSTSTGLDRASTECLSVENPSTYLSPKEFSDQLRRWAVDYSQRQNA